MTITSCFKETYLNKKVLVFGHTGFKGSWLTLWLRELGANIVGASLEKEITKPSHFDVAGLDNHCESHYLDIRNYDEVLDVVREVKPEYVFHLAAQSLVKQSYINPIETFTTNSIGTANILQALRSLEDQCIAILITSDKCYENIETYYGYRETDRLGGKDPYSASKAAAEIIIRSYVHSFLTDVDSIRIATARAGNVIGGGDWALDRLVPDIMKAWSSGEQVEIRSPKSTRPWQHVLEPLSGYLLLGSEINKRAELHGESFNFGPKSEDIFPVADVVEILQKELNGLSINIKNHEMMDSTLHTAQGDS